MTNATSGTKKRVAIYVEEKVWRGVRIKALGLGMSAGDYLVGLHKRNTTGVVEVIVGGGNVSPVVKVPVAEKVVEPVGVIPKVEKPVEKATSDLRRVWREKHPNDMCRVCGELNKNCKC